MKMKIFGKNKAGKGLIVVGGILTAIGVAGVMTTRVDNEDDYNNDDYVDYTELGDAIIEDDEIEEQDTESV